MRELCWNVDIQFVLQLWWNPFQDDTKEGVARLLLCTLDAENKFADLIQAWSGYFCLSSSYLKNHYSLFSSLCFCSLMGGGVCVGPGACYLILFVPILLVYFMEMLDSIFHLVFLLIDSIVSECRIHLLVLPVQLLNISKLQHHQG